MVQFTGIDVNKKKVTYKTIRLKDVYPEPEKLSDGGLSHKNDAGPDLLIGIEYTYTDYNSQTVTKKAVLTADKEIGYKDSDIENFIAQQIPDVELNIQAKEVDRLRQLIRAKNEYDP